MRRAFSVISFTLLTLLSLASTATALELYFPHIASNAEWETEVGIINTGTTSMSGTLYAYSDSGVQVQSKEIELLGGGSIQFVVGEDFTTPTLITNMIFETNRDTCSGYEKFYQPGFNRVAVPAVSRVNTGDLYVTHIASDQNWWTGLALLNTTNTAKTVTITFSNGSVETLTLQAGQHWAGTIQGSFPSVAANEVESAVISNADGIIGLELFGSQAGTGNYYLSGVLLSNETDSSLYYPHIASDNDWWTGIVSYNPGNSNVTLTITAYNDIGTSLTSFPVTVAAKGKYIGTAAALNLPEGTTWFKVEGSAPVTGFELFGTHDGKKLAGYSAVDIDTSEGIFAKLEDQGWTGIAFVNTSISPANVTLQAKTSAGAIVGVANVALHSYGKKVDVAENFFATDISSAHLHQVHGRSGRRRFSIEWDR